MIALGSDHGGFELKETIKKHLEERGIEYKDFGTYSLDSCDYPDFGKAAAEAVASGECEKGIVVCTTGIGISIVANKVKGVRCALCSETTSARLTREHNDANVLALGGGMTGPLLALEIVDTFLDTPFSGLEKHARRISKISGMED
ncbi:ribose 5-phosphate isomerase B [Butyrivibrio sp. DSM 10294]|uniref:ribose 5-phosphate isomerase B n=1 Tax=Butyrivibrio sp. DSM 10294 TaxID=2972457 RepID=UPI00234EBFBB|nr:ribose 5-phosphate isomerase B [Butyrivibrio sp. DSM 10294]MDC7294577.1 ribose 5-phosphate isomerase B [Butyrivibrio sp. DSM 10294]